MELFGTICTVVGVGTISAGAMRLICWLDEGTKKTAPGGKPSTVGAPGTALNENIISIHEIFLTCKGEFDGIQNKNDSEGRLYRPSEPNSSG